MVTISTKCYILINSPSKNTSFSVFYHLPTEAN